MPGWAVSPLVLLLVLLLPQQFAAQTSTLDSTAAESLTPDAPVEIIPAAAAAAVTLQVTIAPWVGRQPPTDDELGFKKPRLQPDPTADRAQTASAAAIPRARSFIVQLKAPSAAALVGPTIIPAAAAAAPADDTAAAAATDRIQNTRTDRITAQAAAAAQEIRTQSAAVAAAAGVTAQVTHSYSYALSGFTVQGPTAAQLAALAADPLVLSVMEDKQVSISTYSTPQFLGLPNRARQVQGSGSKPSIVRQRGVWSQVGTPFLFSFFCLFVF